MLETKPSCIRLERAVLCLDCDTVGDDSKHCVRCQSTAVHPIASFLNRPEPVAIDPGNFIDDWFDSLGVPVHRIT